MTPEELLKPRFLLTNDYPGNNREVGSISIEIHTAEYFRKYRANFRELEWWEGRGKYFWSDGSISKPLFLSNIGKTYYGSAWGIDLETGRFTLEVNGDKTKAHLSNYIPATESEYKEYIKSKQAIEKM